MDIGDICDYCEEPYCERCELGNPCLGCEDYKDGNCLSNGGCAEVKGDNDEIN